MLTHTSLDDFYKRNQAQLPDGLTKEIGHKSVFEVETLFDGAIGNGTCLRIGEIIIRSVGYTEKAVQKC